MREASSPTVISSGILTTSGAFFAISSCRRRIFSCSSERFLVPNFFACCFLFLLPIFCLPLVIVLHALGDKGIDAVVVAVGVDGDGAGIDDAAFALALGLRLFGLLGSLRLRGLLRRCGCALRARLILLRLRTGILLRALVVIVLARAVRVRAQLRRALRLLGILRGLRLGRLLPRRCAALGFWLFLRLGGARRPRRWSRSGSVAVI